MHFRTSAALCAALIALAGAPALAQSAPEPSPSPSSSTAGLGEIGRVSTSDRRDEPAGATSKTTYVVTKAEIVRRGFTTVAAALEDVPGVVVTRNGPVGSFAGVALRGTGTNQTLVLVDGRPLAGAQIGTIDLGALPTAGVERIEIVEGSGATLYGTGAIGGVINIVTVPPNRRETLATVSAATFGENALVIDAPNIAFERRVARNDFAFPAVGSDPAGVRTDVDLASTSLRGRTTTHLGAFGLALDAGIVARHLGVPGTVAFVTPNARQDDVTADARASFTHATRRAALTLDLSGTRESLVYRDPVAAESFTGAPFALLNVESRLQLSLRDVVQNEGGALVYGVDLAHGADRIDAGDGSPPAHGFAQTAVYAQDQLRLTRTLRAYAGLRAERDGAQGGALAPSLGGTWSIGDGLALRANASTAFRAPTAVDLYYPGFSNPNLHPERTKNLDLAFDAANVLGGASLGWFVTAGNDLIVATSSSVENVQRASIAGFTLDVRTRPLNGVTARVNFTDLYRAQNFTAAEQRLPRRPVIVSNVELAYAAAPRALLAAAGLVAHSVGRNADPFGAAPPFTRVDAYARLRLAPRALLSLRVYDLGGERYEDVGGFPMPGRTFAVELSTR
ncbi:MAG: TonB-dependent receptor [Candidatus Eremiobacteraeota bacterium]|nr:TonB-dependent receptor [Candidatus Eremiobacteraeota bacterium]